jgi:virulence factor Mce-like protein
VNIRGRSSSTFANPVLVGAVTILVVIVAVFLSYNANSGLPFVPTYSAKVKLPNAAELVEGNDVRIGGSRVGLISKLEPQREGKKVVAIATVKVQESAGPFEVDSHAIVRQRSALGLKYLEIEPGRSDDTVPPGGLLRNADDQTPAVDFDDVLSPFNEPTREGFQGILRELGTGLAGRGGQLNLGLESLPQPISDLGPVAKNLAAPATRLAEFIRATGATAAGVAPVADELGRFFDAAATTFDALDDPEALGGTLDVAAATLAPDAVDLRAVMPDLNDARDLLVALRPGMDALPAAAADFSSALRRLTPPLAKSVDSFRATTPLIREVRTLSRDPNTIPALRGIRGLSDRITPALTYINPMQTVCNYLGLWFRNVPSFISEGDQLGTWFRAIALTQPDEVLPRADPAPNLHVNQYPRTGQDGHCDAGNQPYLPGQQIGTLPVDTPATTESTGPPVGGLEDLG